MRKDLLRGLRSLKWKLGEPDESGRRRPIAQSDTEYIIDIDMAIMAIGTRANPLLTENTPGLKLNQWGYIEVNERMQTSIPNVFAGGDIVTGAATTAAREMDNYLQNKTS